jgi:hypothetical protein
MVDIPQPLTDSYEIASRAIRDRGVELPGFGSPQIPSKTGTGTRQSRILQQRDGRITRNLVRWFIPETGVVEMYINPQNITYQHKKHITNVRTKGGYVLQYWGEELGTITINGTTGSSGVEGINVLEEIYRNEQVSFDSFALAVEAAQEQRALQSDLSGGAGFNLLAGVANLTNSASDRFFDTVNNVIETGGSNVSRPKPTLANYAFGVEMYWSGWVFRGYFSDFRVDEKSDKIGLFDYNMTFNFTQKRGLRTNFFAWHRSPTDGPSNSDPQTGTPHSFETLSEEQHFPPPQTNEAPTSLNDILGTDLPIWGM